MSRVKVLGSFIYLKIKTFITFYWDLHRFSLKDGYAALVLDMYSWKSMGLIVALAQMSTMILEWTDPFVCTNPPLLVSMSQESFNTLSLKSTPIPTLTHELILFLPTEVKVSCSSLAHHYSTNHTSTNALQLFCLNHHIVLQSSTCLSGGGTWMPGSSSSYWLDLTAGLWFNRHQQPGFSRVKIMPLKQEKCPEAW